MGQFYGYVTETYVVRHQFIVLRLIEGTWSNILVGPVCMTEILFKRI